MKVLQNTAYNKDSLLNISLTEQIEILTEQFCDGMDYGYEIQSVDKGEDGFYTVTAVCPEGAVASTRFMWNPETQIDYYIGESVDAGETWEIHPTLLEDFKDNIANV